MNKRIGIVKDCRYFNHAVKGRRSAENPGRLRNLYLTLDNSSYNGRLLRLTPREATLSELLEIHSQFYLDQITRLSLNDDPFAYDKDTYLMGDTVSTARLAAGGCLTLADRIMEGVVDYGVALVRPPGHHAEPGRGMGFCVVNNMAITAAYLLRTYGLSRILIFDFDVHHGNGTQEAFYETDKVLFASIHQHNLFPFSGKADETGRGRGLGYTVNFPVFPQFADLEYTCLAGTIVMNLAEQYLPQIILVSAGYDGHENDSISDVLLTTDWYRTVTRILRKVAGEYCENRLLMVLEGGYNPESLEASVLATIDTLLEEPPKGAGIPRSERAEKLLSCHPARPFWFF